MVAAGKRKVRVGWNASRAGRQPPYYRFARVEMLLTWLI
jgi:hypothetical protein